MASTNFSRPGLKTARNTLINTTIGASAIIAFYTGTKPGDPSLAPTGTLLASGPANATAFGVVTPGIATTDPTLTANAIGVFSASVAGTPGYCRISTAGGTAVIDCDCGAIGSGAPCIVTPASFVAGQPVEITSITITEG